MSLPVETGLLQKKLSHHWLTFGAVSLLLTSLIFILPFKHFEILFSVKIKSRNILLNSYRNGGVVTFKEYQHTHKHKTPWKHPFIVVLLGNCASFKSKNNYN